MSDDRHGEHDEKQNVAQQSASLSTREQAGQTEFVQATKGLGDELQQAPNKPGRPQSRESIIGVLGKPKNAVSAYDSTMAVRLETAAMLTMATVMINRSDCAARIEVTFAQAVRNESNDRRVQPQHGEHRPQR